jgi:hypothetical protein
MKKFLLISLVFLLAASYQSGAQDVITNHSFEEWDGDPEGWMNPLSILGIQNVIQSTDAQHGSLSAKFIIVYDNNTSSYIPATLNSFSIPVTESHTTLNGYMKGNSVEGDELAISVLLYGGDLIAGTGMLFTAENYDEWTEFSIPINYVGSVAPDQAFIYFAVGGNDENAHEGTEYMVDNLSWDGISGIQDRQIVSDVTAAPNPAIDRLEVQFTLDLSDRMAFDLVTPQGLIRPVRTSNTYHAGVNTIVISTSGLPRGIYFLRASGEKYGFVEKFVVGR